MRPSHVLRLLVTLLVTGLADGPDHAPARAAGPYTVNATIDGTDFAPGDGICEIATGTGLCTLRATLMEANAAQDSDSILLPSGTYTLTLLGDDEDLTAGSLDIRAPLTLQGAGQSSTVIAASATLSDRVLMILANDVNISGVTLRGGNIDTGSGGGIVAGGRVTITASTVRDNYSGYGGAIYASNPLGRLVLMDTTLISNTTIFGGGLMLNGGQAWLTRTVIADNQVDQRGGGVYIGNDGEAWLFDSEVSNNTAQQGGAVAVNTGLATITRSSLRANTVTLDGGAILNEDQVVVVNSTINLNGADRWGGGIYNLTSSVASLYNTTVVFNSADNNADNNGQGGGLAVAGGQILVRNTVVANNGNVQLLTTPVPDDCWGNVSSWGFNLIETTSNCTLIFDLTGDITGQDPLLGPLRAYRGAPPSYSLLPNSPALDAGNNLVGCRDANNPLTTDQRGLPRTADGNGDGVARCDIGAFEVTLDQFLPLTVR